jgi:hypothetical protein
MAFREAAHDHRLLEHNGPHPARGDVLPPFVTAGGNAIAKTSRTLHHS